MEDIAMNDWLKKIMTLVAWHVIECGLICWLCFRMRTQSLVAVFVQPLLLLNVLHDGRSETAVDLIEWEIRLQKWHDVYTHVESLKSSYVSITVVFICTEIKKEQSLALSIILFHF